MKNLLYIITAIISITFFQSCLDREKEKNLEISKIKIDNVKIPQSTMDLFTVQTIKTYSTYASGCDRFYDYDYRTDNFNRIITSYFYKENNACTQATHVSTNHLILNL